MRDAVARLAVFLLFAVLIPPTAYPLTTYTEQNSVGRIVGESPAEMIRQLQRTEIQSQSVSYYSYDFFNVPSKKQILDLEVGNVHGNLDQYGALRPYDRYDLIERIDDFSHNELFVLETRGAPTPLREYTFGDIYEQPNYDEIHPQDVREWQQGFEASEPLLLFEGPYAGSYLPKEDGYVSRLVRDSTIIAPTSFSSPQFTKSFICNLLRDKTIGQVFRDARNFHFNGGSTSGQDNFIGLVLQSYALYGNPRQRIVIPFGQGDAWRIDEECNHFNRNLETGIEYLGQISNLSLFRRHIFFEIPFFEIIDYGNFSVINASNTHNRFEGGELVLPEAIRTTSFPKSSIILNFTYTLEDPVPLALPNLPSYNGSLIERTCEVEHQNVTLHFDNEYTESSQDVIATVVPVEVLNCTVGSLQMFRRIAYSFDYVTWSPMVVSSVDAPIRVSGNERVVARIQLHPTVANLTGFTAVVVNSSNDRLWEGELYSNKTEINASFIAPASEGYQEYSFEIVEGNATLAYYPFSVFVSVLEINVPIPTTVPQNVSIPINLTSFANESFPLFVRHFLFWNGSVVKQGNFSKNITLGHSQEVLTFEGLTRQNQSYELLLELQYLDQFISYAYALVRNNPPLVSLSGETVVHELELLSINVSAVDPDNDTLILAVNDSRLTLEGGILSWTPTLLDDGTYDISVSVYDGDLYTNRTLPLVIENHLWCGDEAGGLTVLTYDILNCTEGLMITHNDTILSCAGHRISGQGYGTGIFINASRTVISDCEVSDFSTGIRIEAGSDAKVRKNMLLGNGLGLSVSSAPNLFSENTLNNAVNAQDLQPGNQWNDSVLGNNWSDFPDNPGYPRRYEIPGPGDGVDWEPLWPYHAPDLMPVGDQVITELEQLVIQLNATDKDGDNLSYAVSGNLSGDYALDTVSGLFSWTPDYAAQGDRSVTFNVTDGMYSDGEHIIVHVLNRNQAPVLFDSSFAVHAGEPIQLTLNASDPDEDTLVFGTNASAVLRSPFQFNPQTGYFFWWPNASDIGVYDVLINVTDGEFVDDANLHIVVMQNLECGDTIYLNATLESDMDCPGTGFLIGADDVSLDCQGHQVTGTQYGIFANWKNGTVIRNCVFSGFGFGMYVDNGIGWLVENNSIINFSQTGIFLNNFNDTAFRSNTIIGEGSMSIGSDLGYVGNLLFEGNTIHASWGGIAIRAMNPTAISSTIRGNRVFQAQEAIYLINTLGVVVEDNFLQGNFHGVFINNADGIAILRNQLDNNSVGLQMVNTENATIRENGFFGSKEYGVYAQSSGDNLFYSNSFANNTVNAREDARGNRWNTTYLGNSWDDFSQNTGYPLWYDIPGGFSADYNPREIESSPVPCGAVIMQNISLMRDILGCNGTALVVAADDILVDCSGHLLAGSGNGSGIVVSGSARTVIRNCRIGGFDEGLLLSSSVETLIDNVSVMNSSKGIHAENAASWSIQRSALSLNDIGLFIFGGSGTLSSSSLNGNRLGLEIVSGQALVQGNTFQDNSAVGMSLHETSDVIATGNRFQENGLGISLAGSPGNWLWGNAFFNESVHAFEDAVSTSSWNQTAQGNYWDDYLVNPSYPFSYDISGPGAGQDLRPNANETLVHYCGDFILEDTLLINDLLNCSGESALSFSTNDTVLDCQGHRIQGTGMYGITSGTVGKMRITVRNCTIQGFARGVYSVQTFNLTLEHIIVGNSTINGIDIYQGRNTYVNHADVSGSGQKDLYLHSSWDSIISDCRLHDGLVGLSIYDSYGTEANRLTIERERNRGIALSNVYGFRLANSTVRSTAHIGISLSSNSRDILVYNNSFFNNTPHIYGDPGSSNVSFNLSGQGNLWEDFRNNTGYPSNYSVMGGYADWHPTWSFLGDIPRFDPVAPILLEEGQPLALDVNASDFYHALLYASDADHSIPGTFYFNITTGLFLWTPGYHDAGTYDVRFNATDGMFTDNLTVDITVLERNAVPEIYSAPVTEAYLDSVYAYDVDADDEDHQTLTYSLGRFPEGMTIDNSSGAISWSPVILQDAEVIVIVTDGIVNTFQPFTINVRSNIVCGQNLSQYTLLPMDLHCPATALVINTSDSVLDCAGHIIFGPGDGSGTGVMIGEIENVSVRNCTISGFKTGFSLLGSRNATLAQNEFISNRQGILSLEGFGLSISKSRFLRQGIGINLSRSGDPLLEDNLLVTTEATVALNGVSGGRIAGNRFFSVGGGGILLVNSTGISFWNNTLFGQGSKVEEDSLSVQNNWNTSIGNFWDDFASNPGYPSHYDIPGSGPGVDYAPITSNRPPIIFMSPTVFLVNETSSLFLVINASDPDQNPLLFSSNADSVLPSFHQFDPQTGILQWTPTISDEGAYVVSFNVSDGMSFDTVDVSIKVENHVICGENITKNTNLTHDITCPGAGLIIGMNNVTLDCKNHTISGIGTGISLTKVVGVVIKNCTMAVFSPHILLTGANSSLIENNTLRDASSWSIQIYDSSNNRIKNNVIAQTLHGIYMMRARNTSIYNNTLRRATLAVVGLGVRVEYGSGTTLFLNHIENYGTGMQVRYTNATTIRLNVIIKSVKGMQFSSFIRNSITENTYINETQVGIEVNDSSRNNVFTGNSFINVPVNARESGDANSNAWNLSLIGNYWSDFLNNSGFPDVYIVPGEGDGIDWHPLWNPAEYSPVLQAIPPQQLLEAETLVIDVNATDPNNDTLNYSTNAGDILRTPFTFNRSTGLFNWTPGYADQGVYVITFNASDGSLSDTINVTITVLNSDRPPELGPVGDREVREDEQLSIQLTAADPDNDTLFFGTNASGSLPTEFFFDPYTGLFIWMPGFSAAGIYSVLFGVTDMELLDQEAVQITVTNVNRPPALDDVGTMEGQEGQLLEVQLHAEDPDNETLFFGTDAEAVLPAGFTFDPVTGLLVWTPGFEDSGSYEVLFNVTDQDLFDETLATLVIANTNRPPDLEPLNNRNMVEGQTLFFTLSAADPDGDSINYSTDAPQVLPGQPVLDPESGHFSWVAPSGSVGVYNVTFWASDSELRDQESMRVSVAERPTGSPFFRKPILLETLEGQEEQD
ncbi:MAG: NosD domain-containing protein [Nanoarchaeota archaeon]